MEMYRMSWVLCLYMRFGRRMVFSFIKDELLRCRWGALSVESRFSNTGVGKVSKGGKH